MFRRLRLECGLVLCLGSSLGLVTSWVVFRFVDRSTYHLSIATTGNLMDDLHVLIYDGRIALSNRFDRDSSGEFRPLIWDASRLTSQVLARGDRCRQLTIPGVDLRCYRNKALCYSIWSLELSMLLLAGWLLPLAACLRSRLVKLKGQSVRDAPRTAC
jgi:hypothetical protein